MDSQTCHIIWPVGHTIWPVGHTVWPFGHTVWPASHTVWADVSYGQVVSRMHVKDFGPRR
eukprot:491505-Lingulodinium_polyedra.AAC.1